MAVRERTQSQSLFAATTSESGRVVSTRPVCLCCSSSHRQSRHDSPGPLHSIYRPRRATVVRPDVSNISSPGVSQAGVS
jgi:hypothetical protein